MAVTGSSWCFHFLVLWVSLSSCFLLVHGLREFIGSCGFRIDLINNKEQSGILRVPMPTSMTEYQDMRIDRHCDITIEFLYGNHLLLELYYLDIVPDKDGAGGGCSTGLEVLDQTNKNVYGNRLCMEAWEWEEKHALSKQEKKVVMTSPVTFRLKSEGPYTGEGFKVHFNQFRPQWPCSNREFKCEEFQRCVHDDLTCDGWDDCGDHTDERREAGCDLLTPSEICALVMGILLFLGTVIVIVLFIVTYKRQRMTYGLVRTHAGRSDSKLPIADRLSIDASMSKRFNSQESMGTHYSRNTARYRRDSDSSIDKIELEKSDRVSSKFGLDNQSERSYRSHPKSRARSLALGSEASFDTGSKKSGQYTYSGGRRGRATSSNDLNKGEAPLRINGIDNPVGVEDEKEKDHRNGRLTPDRRSNSSRRRADRDYSDYSDEEEERRRRRRRSRDRRSRRYSDDDDDSYDSYDDRRRRRRRRSYSDDDDSYDSEYERERRRRRRSKERKRRSRELDDGEEKEGEENPDREARRRRDSRDRNRDSYDSEEEDRRRRRRRRRSRSPSYDDKDDEDRDRRRRRRRSPSPDQDDTDKPRDAAERMSRAIAKEMESKVPRDERDGATPPPPSSFRPVTPKHNAPPSGYKDAVQPSTPPKQTPQPDEKRRAASPVNNSRERSPPRHRQDPNPPPASREPSFPAPPPVSVKQPSNHSYHPPAPQQPKHRPPPVTAPPTPDDVRQMEAERERRRSHNHQQRLQKPMASSPPPSSGAEMSPADEDRTRRRSQDDRRQRYSRDRWTARNCKGGDAPRDPSPPEYEDVNPRVQLDAPRAGYREETV